MSISKICMHWTAGSNNPCQTDIDAYHFIFDSAGKEFKGKFAPEDNINCYDGKYAKHCGGGNTGCIGLSCCGMAGFDLKNKQTKYPITKKQVEAMCCKAAKLCIKYGIQVAEETVFTHYEFDQKRPAEEREGKSDIAYLPYLPNISKDRAGEYLRNKISWYITQIKKGKKL